VTGSAATAGARTPRIPASDQGADAGADRAEGGQTRATFAYRRMRDDILTGTLAPNSKLLMRELQERYALGLAPLREALARLHAEELVQFSDHRGYWVCPISTEELRDLTHMRMLLEEEALRTSIAKGDDAWEAGVVGACHRLARLTERGAQLSETTLPDWETAHEDFHRAIIAAAGSRLLLRLRASLTLLVRRYRLFALSSAGDRDHLAEHRAIKDATVGRDADRAVRLLGEHYDLTTCAILAKIEEVQP